MMIWTHFRKQSWPNGLTTTASGSPNSSRNRDGRLPNKVISHKIYRSAQATLIKLFKPSLFLRSLGHGLSDKAD